MHNLEKLEFWKMLVIIVCRKSRTRGRDLLRNNSEILTKMNDSGCNLIFCMGNSARYLPKVVKRCVAAVAPMALKFRRSDLVFGRIDRPEYREFRCLDGTPGGAQRVFCKTSETRPQARRQDP